MSAISANDDSARVQALKRYGILDTDQEQLYDDFTRLAAQICDTPISLISLVDEDRQWFKSKFGITIDQTPKEYAFCSHAISHPNELLVVKNALEDERFAGSPLVTGEPHIRSYAGAPLVTAEGYAIGTLCVIDQKPRNLTQEQLSALRILARQIVTQLDAQMNVKLLNEIALQLETEQEETRLILDSVPAYVFFKDTQNNIVRVNKPVAESLGKTASEIEGQPTALFYPEFADDFYKDDLEVIQSKRAKLGIVERINTDDGDLRWIRTDKIPIANKHGEIERLLVLALDITELKETEQSLRVSQDKLREMNAHLEELVAVKTAELAASKSQYEDLYENAPDMSVSINPWTRCILHCNRTFFNETGYEAEDLIGKPVFTYLHPRCLDDAKKAIEQFRGKGILKDVELVIQRKDGSEMDVSLSSSAIRDGDGQIIASRSIFRDLTEKKRLEQEIKKNADQLSHLARVATMNEMATGVAHELNQPLHAIKNYAEGALLRLKNKNFDPKFLETLFEDIVADADRAADLILSFRRFVKPSQKRSSLISPKELAGRLSRLIAREVESLGAQLVVEIADDTPPVMCDSVQIKQVLLNLILNARDAIAEAATTDPVIRLIIGPTGEHAVRFAVVDRGPGFANMDAEKMFDAFYTTKDSGLGMGLAICQTIVQTHGGELVATENEGPGLTMSFELPAAVGQTLDTSVAAEER